MRWIPQVTLLVSAVAVVGCGTSGDIDLDPSQVTRAGVGAECFELVPETADFGTPETLCRVERSLTLRNVCASSVTVTDLKVDSPTGEFAFTQSPAIPLGGLNVASGDALYLGVAFTGREPRAASGEIRVTTDDAGSKVTRSWPLSSSTTEWRTQTDSFKVPRETPTSDLLVVIDNAPEMEALLPSVRRNLLFFGKYVEAARIDARIGIALVAPSGFHIGHQLAATPSGQLFLDTHDANWTAELTSVLEEITTSPSDHASFDTAIDVFENQGGTFLRDGAAKGVLFISASNDLSSVTVSEALNRMRELTAMLRHNWQFAVSAIVPVWIGSTCVDQIEDGRFTWAAVQTNGVMDSLCTPDWSKTLEPLDKVAFGFRKEFMLDEPADVIRGEVHPAIDGVELPSIDVRGASVWTYDGERNSVLFEPMYAPEPGQTLTVTYPLFCSQ